MDVNDIYSQLDHSITKFSDIPVDDKEELEKVIAFGISAIETIEALVDVVLVPIINAKNELFKSRDAEKVQNALVEIANNMYDELDNAQDMVFKFSALNDSFHREIAPVLSKYFDTEEINRWEELFNLTKNTRSLSYERVESLIPKVNDFLDSRFYSPDSIKADLTFKELKDYLDDIIENMRATKKEIQAVKSKFLLLMGLKGITSIAENKIAGDNKTEELEDVLNNIVELVSKARIETALKRIEDLTNHNYPEIFDEVILYQNQYSSASRNISLGLNEDKITLNKVADGILRLVNEIRELKKLT